ncbi:MAG TPA: hypothetical protein VLA88_00985 [Candidatus Saccharimonadales bacterium]|nr:hypothetical protein [Candidatus Saccharimonadales bacterium]
MTLISYFASGARDTIWLALVYAVLQLVVFILSFKYGVGGLGKLDVACLIGAFMGIAGWIITDNPVVALYLSIFAELMGWLPLFKKVYAQPKTENTLSWVIGTVAAFVNLFALTSWHITMSLYPLYIFATQAILVLLLVFPGVRMRPRKASRLAEELERF